MIHLWATRARKGQRRRWVAVVGAGIAAAAASAVVPIGGAVLASGPSSTPASSSSAIKACYKTGTTLATLQHLPTTKKCPTADTTLTWNKVGRQGPPGPAGVSVGSSGSSSSAVPLTTADALTPVLSSAAVATSGTYYVNASIMLVVGTGDGVACILSVHTGEMGEFATVGSVPNVSYQTLPLNASLTLTAGTPVGVLCADYTGNASTEFYDGSITATLIDSPTGSAPATGTAAVPALPALPALPAKP